MTTTTRQKRFLYDVRMLISSDKLAAVLSVLLNGCERLSVVRGAPVQRRKKKQQPQKEGER
jgi:hypothetical protein